MRTSNRLQSLFVQSITWLLSASLFLVATPLTAATITVSNTNDAGTGSLRKAIADASAGDVIDFSITGVISLTSGELSITKNLTITGPGASQLTVSGNLSSRVFNLSNSGIGGSLLSPIVFSGITIANGRANAGAGIYVFHMRYTLTNCILTNNVATGNGGAIFNTTGIGRLGISITNCLFLNNGAANGGAIASESQISSVDLTLTGCSFRGNVVSGDGGAILNQTVSNSVSPVLNNCSFIANSANRGGAMFSNGAADVSQPVLTNCSFQRNSATQGGGIYTEGNPGIGRATLTNCSFQSNTATQGGAMANDGSADAPLTNCVFFDNGGSNSFVRLNTFAGRSRFVASYCFIEPSVVTGVDISGPGNLTALTVSPYESATSVALYDCSPAVNAGNPATTTVTVGTTDLVGQARFFNNGTVDMGAVEFQTTPNQPIVFTNQPASISSVCVGVSVSVPVSVTGTGPLTYQWYRTGSSGIPAILTGNTSATTSTLTIPSATTADAGSYSVVVTGACNSVTSTAFVLSVPEPSALLTPSSSGLCAGGSVVLTGSGAGAGGTYAFSGPGGLSQSGSSPTLSVTQTGTYALTVTTGIGCTAITSLTLNVALTPTVVITLPNGSTVSVSGNLPTLTLPPNGPLVLQASGGASYERLLVLDRINGYEIRQVDQNTTGIFPITTPGLFTLTVTGANGCSRTVQGAVERL
jgi:predicted outer membrane repeat protein